MLIEALCLGSGPMFYSTSNLAMGKVLNSRTNHSLAEVILDNRTN